MKICPSLFKHIQRVSWVDELVLHKWLQHRIVYNCKLEHKNCIAMGQMKWNEYPQDGTPDEVDGRQRISGHAHTWPISGHIAPLVSMIVNHNSFKATTYLKSMWSMIIKVNNHFDTKIGIVYRYQSHQLCQLCWIQIYMYYKMRWRKHDLFIPSQWEL